MNIDPFLEQFLYERRPLTQEEVRQQFSGFNQAQGFLNEVSGRLDALDGRLLYAAPMLQKPSSQFITYPHYETNIDRTPENDRVFPFETVALQRFRTNHDRDLEGAIIHTGSYADELTRMYNVLALTIGSNIFFRNNSYNPGSEEGRKTLAHELTHVSQYQTGGLAQNKTREAIEAEAEKTERQEVQDKDAIICIVLKGRRYLMPRSKMKYYAQKAARNLVNWIERQKTVLGEKEYLSLLCAFEEWLERRG